MKCWTIENDTTGLKWKWSQVKPGGSKYSPRCGVALTSAPGGKVYTFGGVFDIDDEDEEDISGTFYNNLHCLDWEKLIFRTVLLSGKKESTKTKKRRRNKDNDEGEVISEDECETVEETPQEAVVHTVADDGVFKVTVGPAASSSDGTIVVSNGVCETKGHPHPRMNCGLAVKHGTLYLYGGLYENGDRMYTFSDLHALDLHKLEEWNTLVSCDLSSQDWFVSSSETESSSEEDDDDDEPMDTD